MKFLQPKDLQAGMVIVKPIYKGRRLLLAANHKLTQNVVNIMRRNNYPGTFVYDEYSDYDDLKSLLNEEIRAELLEAAKDFDIDKVVYLSNDLVNDLLSKDSDFVLELNNLSIYDSNTFEHSVNTALMATSCGIGMGLDNEDLAHLSAAAILHDCGKMAVPLEILNKPGKLDDREMQVMQHHVQYGYDMLYTKYNIHSSIRGAIICHHENWDGTGYEKGLKGEEIPLFARIIHVADVYDALLRKRPYKSSLSQSECIEYLMGGGGTKFDFSCITTFLKYISVYPVGTDVVLSDGRIARVVKNHRGYLERPTVVTDNEVLDLANDMKLLNITVISAVDDSNLVNEEMEEQREKAS